MTVGEPAPNDSAFVHGYQSLPLIIPAGNQGGRS